MVKTPRTRHSKSTKEPVTIDLAPDEVSRVEAEAEAAEAAPQQADSSPQAPDPAGEAQPASPDIEDYTAATTESPEDKPDEPAAASSAFGRREQASLPPGRRGGNLAAAGIAGGGVALLLVGGLHFSGLLAGSQPAQQDQSAAVSALESQIADLRQQVSALEGGTGDDDALAARLADTEERVTQLAATLDAVRTEVAALGDQAGGETAQPVDLAPVEERIASLESAIADIRAAVPAQTDLSGVEETVAALREEIAAAREGQAASAARLDTLEQALARLGEQVEEQAETPATAIIIAASALKAAIDRGAPFTTELDTFAALAPDAPQVDGLRAHAETGVATRAQLSADANAAANAMIAAARPIDPDAGVVDRLWASAMGLVQVRPVGMIEGQGVPEVVARIDAAVAAGDYERAVAEFDTLPDAAKAAGEPFMARLRARQDADRLVDEALAGALRS